MKKAICGLIMALPISGLLILSGAGPASAGEGDKYLAPPPIAPPWAAGLMVRLRGLGVVPDEDADNITAAGAPIAADLNIDNSIVPELDLTYFFTPNIAAELILAVTPHDISGTGALAGYASDAWLLPPTLLAQYHFNPGAKFKPYVGAGLNYTVFFNEDDKGRTVAAGLTTTNTKLDDEFGWALQAGVDIHIRDNMYLNLDVKKLWLYTEATVRTTANTTVRADVDINPWIVGIGVGWKLGPR
jgi:outer membrane protein